MPDPLNFKVASVLLEKYCLYRQKYVRMTNPSSSPYPVQTVKHRFTDGDVLNHLAGEMSLCVFAGPHATSFLTVDVDLGDHDVVRKVVDTMSDLGVPRELIYVSSSGRKGYHVDIFFEPYVYNNVAHAFYKALIERSGLNPRKVEFRPTSRQAIKLPLGVHQTTQRRCWFVDRETLEPIESFDPVFSLQCIPQQLMNDIIKRCAHSEHKKRDGRTVTRTGASDSQLVITEPGTRHNLQKKVAARARLDGNDWDGIVRAQIDWYRLQRQDLIASSEKEVHDDAERLATWAVRNITPKQHDTGQHTALCFHITSHDIPYVLNAPTRATRLVLFLLMMFCKLYDEPMISYETIATMTGVSEATAIRAVGWLAENGHIGRERTYYHPDEFTLKCGANKYIFPGTKKFRAPNRKFILADNCVVGDFISCDNIMDVYARTLATICTEEYLAKFLTKPELEECKKYVRDDARPG